MANLLIDIVNGFIDGLITALNFILQILPDSPFRSVDLSFLQPYLANFNWLVPVRQILIFLGAWLSAVLIYYAYTVILRVTKAID
ncbi:MAG: hypothetical protein RSD63_06395 [Eubacterium sp.]